MRNIAGNHLKVNRENWVPVVVGDLRDDALHGGGTEQAVRAQSALLIHP